MLPAEARKSLYVPRTRAKTCWMTHREFRVVDVEEFVEEFVSVGGSFKKKFVIVPSSIAECAARLPVILQP